MRYIKLALALLVVIGFISLTTNDLVAGTHEVRDTHRGGRYVELGTVTKIAPRSVKEIKSIAGQPATAISDSFKIKPTAVAPLPTSDAKAFIYSHESGNVACKINGGAIDCGYQGEKACGLGQALPCSKLRAVCSLSDYACQDNFFTQYMQGRYGTWENAVAFWNSHQWW